MTSYFPGDEITLTAVFTPVGPAPVDPPTVVFTVEDPEHNVTTPAVSTVDGVTFTATLVASEIAGQWEWRAQATGSVEKSGQSVFVVTPFSF